MVKSDCPTEQDLAAFNLGDLPEASLETITPAVTYYAVGSGGTRTALSAAPNTAT